MSNYLNVRRVSVQEIDAEGRPLGKPDYGVLASDDFEQSFNVTFQTLQELNEAIETAGNILSVAGGFDDIAHDKIGTANFAGNPDLVEAENDYEETEEEN